MEKLLLLKEVTTRGGFVIAARGANETRR